MREMGSSSIALLVGLLLSTASPAQLPRFDIVSILESCDQDALLEMTGVIFRAKDTEPLLQEVAREWIGKNSKSGRASACLRKPEVQILIADALAQGIANGYHIDVEKDSIAALLRANVDNANEGWASIAITGLSYVPDAPDLRRFAQLIRSTTGARRSAAIEALALNCSPEAARLLEEVATPEVLAEVARVSDVRKSKCDNRSR